MNRLRQEGDWVLTIPASLYCHQRSYRNQKKSKNSLYSGNILITQDNLPSSCVFIRCSEFISYRTKRSGCSHFTSNDD